MTINDLVLPMETCKRLKAAGFEFSDSVFVWLVNNDDFCFIVPRESTINDKMPYYVATLTLHEVYCWVLKLVCDNKLDLADYPKLFYNHREKRYDNDSWNGNSSICFSTGGSPVPAGTSEELNPLLAADRYINNLLDKGVLRK